MNAVTLLHQIAETDATFRREGRTWTGRCLICNGPLGTDSRAPLRGPLCFDAATGEGASVEHFRPRILGGGNDPSNLGIAHRRCNGEKGIHWDGAAVSPSPFRGDGGPRRRAQPDQYAALVERLLRERRRRWREPATKRISVS